MKTPDSPAHRCEEYALSDKDFTESHYREILGTIGGTDRHVVSYNAIPWGKNYVIWRHDLDYSINRGLRLAELDADHGVHSTFFINLHSPFYNALERSQTLLLRQISGMGHDIGVHFDWYFHHNSLGEEWEIKIAEEARILADLVEKDPVAVSFHNPNEALLKIGKERLGGLVNTYSRKLMLDSGYHSDSNGYWRHERIIDVVGDPSATRLQVLTHPEWWLDTPMPPRHRIHRAAFGRARAAMKEYDQLLERGSRNNIGVFEEAMGISKDKQIQGNAFWEQLLSEGREPTLFIEVWRSLIARIRTLTRMGIAENSNLSAEQLDTLIMGEPFRKRLLLMFFGEFKDYFFRDNKNYVADLSRLEEIALSISCGTEEEDAVDTKMGLLKLLKLHGAMEAWEASAPLETPAEPNTVTGEIELGSDYTFESDGTSKSTPFSPANLKNSWRKIASSIMMQR